MIPVEGLELGQYRIVGEIGRGGMATVYRAYQASLDRHVAFKVLHAEGDAEFRERFKREARTLAHLRHPNIVQVYDLGEQDNLLYIVMELIEGTSLRQRLGAPWKIEQAVPIVAQLASALDFAHSRDVIHRDVKPANILLEDDRALLADFGIARLVHSTSSLTRSDASIGTPDYMSPEQAAAEPVGPGSDIYSLGVVAYELLAGKLPFSADTPLALLHAQIYKPVPRATDLNEQLSEDVADVLEKVLAKKPEDRHRTAMAFASDLERAAHHAGQATRATRLGRSDETQLTGLYRREAAAEPSAAIVPAPTPKPRTGPSPLALFFAGLVGAVLLALRALAHGAGAGVRGVGRGAGATGRGLGHGVAGLAHVLALALQAVGRGAGVTRRGLTRGLAGLGRLLALFTRGLGHGVAVAGRGLVHGLGGLLRMLAVLARGLGHGVGAAGRGSVRGLAGLTHVLGLLLRGFGHGSAALGRGAVHGFARLAHGLAWAGRGLGRGAGMTQGVGRVANAGRPAGGLRRRVAVVGGCVVALAVVGGGAYALTQAKGRTAQPAPVAAAPAAPVATQPATAVPPSATPAPAATPAAPATATAAPAAPTAAPTATAAESWQALGKDLDGVWGKDWPKAIGLIDGFLTQFKDFPGAKEKLYAALLSYAAELSGANNGTAAVQQLQRAQGLFPDRPEAAAALAALTPSPTPTTPPPPTSTPVQTVRQTAPPPAAPTPASQPRAGFTPTF